MWHMHTRRPSGSLLSLPVNGCPYTGFTFLHYKWKQFQAALNFPEGQTWREGCSGEKKSFQNYCTTKIKGSCFHPNIHQISMRCTAGYSVTICRVAQMLRSAPVTRQAAHYSSTLIYFLELAQNLFPVLQKVSDWTQWEDAFKTLIQLLPPYSNYTARTSGSILHSDLECLSFLVFHQIFLKAFQAVWERLLWIQ